MPDVDLHSLPSVLLIRDLPYLPLPNRVEVLLTDAIPPHELTRTGFMLPFTPEGNLILAVNRRRGAEASGGHIEPGEDARAAAIRESFEETGARVDRVQPLGCLRMTSEGQVPEGWRYPHPVGFQAFFTGITEHTGEYEPNDECLVPRMISPAEALAPDGPLTPTLRLFHARAFELVFGYPPAEHADLAAKAHNMSGGLGR